MYKDTTFHLTGSQGISEEQGRCLLVKNFPTSHRQLQRTVLTCTSRWDHRAALVPCFPYTWPDVLIRNSCCFQWQRSTNLVCPAQDIILPASDEVRLEHALLACIPSAFVIGAQMIGHEIPKVSKNPEQFSQESDSDDGPSAHLAAPEATQVPASPLHTYHSGLDCSSSSLTALPLATLLRSKTTVRSLLRSKFCGRASLTI